MTRDEELTATLDELERVRRHTRAAVHPAWFPLVVFGLIGLASIPFTRIGEGVDSGVFWLVAGPAGGIATSRYYTKRAVTLGAAARGRASCALGVVLFVAAWMAGSVTDSAAAPMLAVAIGYLVFAWLERSWPTGVVAAFLGVAAVVVAVTDPENGDLILTLVFGVAFTVTGLLLRRRDPVA